MNCGQNAPEIEEYLRRQHKARQENGPRLGRRGEAWGDSPNELRSKDFTYPHQGHQEQAHHCDHYRESAPALVFLVFCQIAGKDRNKGYTQSTSGNQIIQKIRQGEGSVVGVCNRVRTNLVGHRPLTKKTQQAAQQHSRHHDSGGLGNSARQIWGGHLGKGTFGALH